MIPLTTRDAADWSMICAYLRLDDEGRKRVIEEIEYQTSRMMKEREEERRAWLSKEYILMSIKPHYADLIYTERKRFEYRKRAPKLVDLPILLYETAPVQKVTGIIADWSILQASPEAVWTYSKTHSGLTADRFFGYYEGYDKAVAIRIYSVVPFKDSLELQTLNPELKRPPQSFCYVQSELDLPMKG